MATSAKTYRIGMGNPSGDLQQPGEQGPPVDAAMGGLDQVLGMRHQAEHVLVAVEDAGDVVERAVGIGALGVAERDLAVVLDGFERRGVGEVIAVVMGDGRA